MNLAAKNALLLEYLHLELQGYRPVALGQELYGEYSNIYYKPQGDTRIYIKINVGRNKFTGVVSWMAHMQVENLLEDLLDQYDLRVSDYPWTLKRGPLTGPADPALLEVLNQAQETRLTGPEVIEQVALLIWEYIEGALLPLWDRYTDLHFIHREIVQKVPQMKLADYIGGYMPLKKLIIMKLCADPDYPEYTQWLRASYERGVVEKPDYYEKRYQAYLTLEDRLAKL
jgi:hypothetical protein